MLKKRKLTNQDVLFSDVLFHSYLNKISYLIKIQYNTMRSQNTYKYMGYYYYHIYEFNLIFKVTHKIEAKTYYLIYLRFNTS